MKSFIFCVVLFLISSAAFGQEKPQLEIIHPVMKEGWVVKTGRGGRVDIFTREGKGIATYYVSEAGVEMNQTGQLHGKRLWATINGKVYQLGAISFVRQEHDFVVLWHEPVSDLEEVRKSGLNRPGKPMALISARNLVEVGIFLTKEEAEASVSKAE